MSVKLSKCNGNVELWKLRCVHTKSETIFRVAQNAWVYSLDHSPCSHHERRDAPRGAGLISMSRRNTRADWPELRDDRLKVEIIQLGAKIAPLKTRRCQRVGNIASPQMRRPGKYRSHKRLYVDISWDLVARKNSFAFVVNAPLGIMVVKGTPHFSPVSLEKLYSPYLIQTSSSNKVKQKYRFVMLLNFYSYMLIFSRKAMDRRTWYAQWIHKEI